jgi:hypothetical protein
VAAERKGLVNYPVTEGRRPVSSDTFDFSEEPTDQALAYRWRRGGRAAGSDRLR